METDIYECNKCGKQHGITDSRKYLQLIKEKIVF